MYQDFLPLVEKPARYIDSEVNVVRKDLAAVATKVCLFFPDTYEVGMSHLGLRILYHILNSREDTACERVFSPWRDYEERLRAAGRTLTSLESNLPLAQFDIIGVTLQYELSYTNILAGLGLAGIPLRSADRGEQHPVVIGGGPCAVNPGPLEPFFDVFFIGDAEEAIHEVVELRQQLRSREAYLAALAERDGFYVPRFGRRPVRRRVLRDIESAAYPDRPLVPLMKPVHDRVNVEVARGCIRGCRYCQAGMIYRPYRERSPETVKALISDSLRCTGYDELSLTSLSAGDYSSVERLMSDLVGRYRDERVSISLPSLRIGTLTPEMVRAVAGVRKTGFTLAPEAGSERLRTVINKPLSELDLIDAAETIFSSGWSVLKLYFMIGLPTETQEDLDGIVRLCRELLTAGKRTAKRHVQLNVSVSTFVPKPHTPFQWFGQVPFDEIKEKQAFLADRLRSRSVSLKPHSPEMSLLEAAFSRGDERLAPVIETAMKGGRRFDGWSEEFDPAAWRESFKTQGLDPEAFASRTFGLAEPLPWDHVQTGVTKEFLKKEYDRALRGTATEHCRARCQGCGVGCTTGGRETFGVPAASPRQVRPDQAKAAPSPRPEMTARIRIKYTKLGRVRFLSHLDFMTLVHRAAVRAGVPLAYTQGFNPHPRIAFGPALSVGVESEAEYLDMETDPFADALGIVKALNAALPEGVRVREARTVPKKAASLSGGIARYSYVVEVPGTRAQGLEQRIEACLARPSIIVDRNGKQADIRPAIESLKAVPRDGGMAIELTLVDTEKARAKVHELVGTLFGVDGDEAAVFAVRRTALFMNERGRWISPMDVA